MKIIGLIGGMSWESSAEYYRIINQEVRDRLGGHHSAKILLYSFDFQPIERMQHQGKWADVTNCLINAATQLEKVGADFLLLCTNTMHKVASAIEGAINIPLLHIADTTAEEIERFGISSVGLLGTKFTMEQDFYKARLSSKHGLKVIIPSKDSRETVHTIIYNELCLGKMLKASKKKLCQVIDDLQRKGAEGVILGCTELPLLFQGRDAPLPVFDTITIHAQKAVSMALEEMET